MFARIKTEPAVVTSALVAIVGVAATLGIIGTDQQAQYVAAITAVVPIVAGFFIRAKVTPAAKSDAAVALAQITPDPVAPDVPAPDKSTPDAQPAPAAEPAPPAPVEDPVKAQLKAAIETVRANSNALNDARAQAAKAAVDASS